MNGLMLYERCSIAMVPRKRTFPDRVSSASHGVAIDCNVQGGHCPLHTPQREENNSTATGALLEGEGRKLSVRCLQSAKLGSYSILSCYRS